MPTAKEINISAIEPLDRIRPASSGCLTRPHLAIQKAAQITKKPAMIKAHSSPGKDKTKATAKRKELYAATNRA